jgi:hypothetical protein
MRSAILLALLGCGGGETPLAKEIRAVRAATVGAGGRIVAEAPLDRRGWSASVSWELEMNLGWSAFKSALKTSLLKGYVVAPDEHGEEIRFVKGEEADTYQLQVEIVIKRPPVRIRARFIALPW